MSRRWLCSLAPVVAVVLALALPARPAAQDKKPATAPTAATALTVEVYQDKGDDYRFRIRSGDTILAIASKGYEKKADCLHAIETLKKDMAKATVVEMPKDKK